MQHSFWVVLGTLSVLRSNALATGQNVVRAILGTAAGFVVAAGLLAVIGTNTTLLWFLLPPAILLAGLAPAAVSFAAGQAAFTLVLVILFTSSSRPAGGSGCCGSRMSRSAARSVSLSECCSGRAAPARRSGRR